MSGEEQKQPASPQAGAAEEAKDDYRKKYEELQGKYQRLDDQLKSAQGTLDTLDQYGAINWDKISGTPAKDEPEPPKMDNQMQQILQRQEGRILTLQFRVDNPDLREYEDSLVAPFVMKARTQNPRKSQDEILKIASDDVRTFLKKHEESVLARAKEAKAAEDKKKMEGLDSDSTTTPEPELDEAQARQNYVDFRRNRQKKMKGIA